MWSSMKTWILNHNVLMPICIAAVFGIIAITIALYLIYKLSCKNQVCDNNTVAITILEGMSQGMIEYSVEELKQATNIFGENNFMGSGSFGQTYIGLLQDTIVAIKRIAYPLHPRFLSEVIKLSNIRHCNVVNLLGYCCENEQQMLVYEYLVNGSIRDYLRGSIGLDFKKRIYIALGAAKGLLYLHSLTPPLIHNRFNAANVLLDVDLNAKVSDAGLSRMLETRYEEANHDHDLEVGFHYQRRLNGTSDVYSFGLFLIELISGEEPGTLSSPYEICQWLIPRIETYTFTDQRMNGTFTREALESVIEIMMRCLAFPAIRRPNMEKIVTELEKIYLNDPTGEDSFPGFAPYAFYNE